MGDIMKARIKHCDDGQVVSWLLLADDYGLRSYGVGDTYSIEGDERIIPLFLSEAEELFDFDLITP